jgi:hypothetical protein
LIGIATLIYSIKNLIDKVSKIHQKAGFAPGTAELQQTPFAQALVNAQANDPGGLEDGIACKARKRGSQPATTATCCQGSVAAAAAI